VIPILKLEYNVKTYGKTFSAGVDVCGIANEVETPEEKYKIQNKTMYWSGIKPATTYPKCPTHAVYMDTIPLIYLYTDHLEI
jgi:hypothetical protein